jgi:hypothetical protein
MGFAKIKGELVSRIGQPVNNKSSKDVHEKGGGYICGEIIDEIWADEEINKQGLRSASDPHDWGDYSFLLN